MTSPSASWMTATKVEITACSTHGFFAAGRESHCSVHRNTIVKLAHTYRSPLFFCDLEVRTIIEGVQGKGSQHSRCVENALGESGAE